MCKCIVVTVVNERFLRRDFWTVLTSYILRRERESERVLVLVVLELNPKIRKAEQQGMILH